MVAAVVPARGRGPQLERARTDLRRAASLPRGARARAVRAHGRAGRGRAPAQRPHAACQSHQVA